MTLSQAYNGAANFDYGGAADSAGDYMGNAADSAGDFMGDVRKYVGVFCYQILFFSLNFFLNLFGTITLKNSIVATPKFGNIMTCTQKKWY